MLKLKKYFNKTKNLTERYPIVFVTAFFILLTFLFTYPLVLNFDSQLPKGGGDTYQGLSNIDLRVRALEGMDLVGQIKTFFAGLGTYSPYVFLSLFLSKYAAYNTMFFLSYILSGLGAYLLADHFTKRRGASLVAGTIFAFAPFHYYQTVAVHLGSMQQQWIPFAALFLLKFLEEFKFKDYALFLFFLLMLAISEHQLLAFSLLFLLTLAVVKIWQDRMLLKNKKLWAYLGISILFFVALIFLVFGDLFTVATSGDNFLDPGSGAAKKYAMKPWEPLLPPSFQAFWPGVNEWLRKTVKIEADWRDSYFISFTVLAILGTFTWQVLRRRKSLFLEKKDEMSLKLWGVTFLVMYIFAWGPGLKILNVDVPLPYALVYKFMPFYENIRVTGRIFMFAMLALAILTSYAIKYLQPRLQNVNLKKKFIFILLVLIMMEFWVGPLKTMSLAYSPFYDKIAQEKEAYRILEIPGSTDYEFASYKLFTNNVHGKLSVDGMALARSIDGQYNWQRTTPVIKPLLYTLPKGNDPGKEGFEVIPQQYFELGTDILNYNNIRYVTLNKKYLEESSLKLAESFIEKYFLLADKYEDEYLVAYEIAKKIPSGFYAKINSDSDQWSIDIKNGDKMVKKAGDGATMTIMNLGQRKNVQIRIVASGANVAKFFLSGKEFILGADMREYVMRTEIVPGENVFTFEVENEGGEKVQIDNRKKKREGMLVQEIEIKEIANEK